MPSEHHKELNGRKTKKRPHLVSVEQVARIADLAKLSLTPQEREKYSAELSTILDYFNVIDTASVSDVQSAYFAASLTNAFRGEEVVATDPEPILAGVPKRKGRFVKAPRVS